MMHVRADRLVFTGVISSGQLVLSDNSLYIVVVRGDRGARYLSVQQDYYDVFVNVRLPQVIRRGTVEPAGYMPKQVTRCH